MREIVLDTETTGLNPAGGHRIVEIGCVELIGKVRTGKHFHAYLNPERPMPREAMEVHGLSDEFLADKPRFSEVAEKFLDFIRNSPLVIHNAEFDVKFLNAELRAVERDVIPIERAVDTVIIARKKFPGSPANLDALCRRYNINASARKFHGALLDAELLADVYVEMMGGTQSSMFIAGQAEKGEGRGAGLSPSKAKVFKEPRIFAPTEEEITQHREFLEHYKIVVG